MLSCAALSAVVPKKAYCFLDGVWRQDNDKILELENMIVELWPVGVGHGAHLVSLNESRARLGLQPIQDPYRIVVPNGFMPLKPCADQSPRLSKYPFTANPRWNDSSIKLDAGRE